MELAFRGVSGDILEKDVDGLRRQLRAMITSTNTFEPVIVKDVEFETRLKECVEKYEEFCSLVDTYDGTVNLMRKIGAKLRYLVCRCESFNSSVGSEIAKRMEIRSKAINLLLKFEKSVRTRAASVQEVRTMLSNEAGTSDRNAGLVTLADLEDEDEELGTRASSTPTGRSQHRPSIDFSSILTHNRPASKLMPVHKWNIKFKGDKSQSINAFLRDVEELRIARGYTKEELYQSAIDLFEGKAALWFRSIRRRVETWDELEQQLLEEFLPVYYNDLLMDEIKARTQGSDESIGMYLAVMDGLFSFLKPPMAEDDKLRILRRNILPFYQTQLGLFEVVSVDKLRELCRKLEVTRVAVDSFIPPAANVKTSVEPYYAYVGSKPKSSLSSVAVSSNVRCWGCNGKGHLQSSCTRQKSLKCFGCGKEGVVKSNCPVCKAKAKETPTNPQGNGSGKTQN